MPRTEYTIADAIPENSSAQYRCTFVDPAGVAIAGVAISAILATWGVPGGAAINGREAQNVRNANGGTVTAEGVFTLNLTAADTISIGTAQYQERLLTLQVTYTTGTLTHDVHCYIRNLVAV